MQQDFSTRLNYGQEAESNVFSFLTKEHQTFIDTRNGVDSNGRHVKFDFIMEDVKYDIKRQYDSTSECIKVCTVDRYGKPATLFGEDNEADLYGFVERDQMNVYIIVPKGAIIRALEQGYGVEEICSYDNTHGKYINKDFLITYKVINPNL